MKKKTKLIFTIAVVAMLIYLPFANSIAGLFVPKANRVKPCEVSEQDAVPDFYGALEDNQYLTDRLETAVFTGWAHSTDASASGEASGIRLLFMGDKGAYRSEAASRSEHSEARAVFGAAATEPQRFTAQISTLLMKNDSYKLYIEIFDADKVKARIDTGKTFRKKNADWRELGMSDKVIPAGIATPRPELKCYILPGASGERGLYIEGWAYIEGSDSLQNNMFAQLSFQSGKTLWYPIRATDSLASALRASSVDAIRSTYTATLPYDDMEEGKAALSIVIEENGSYAVSQAATEFDVKMR